MNYLYILLNLLVMAIAFVILYTMYNHGLVSLDRMFGLLDGVNLGIPIGAILLRFTHYR